MRKKCDDPVERPQEYDGKHLPQRVTEHLWSLDRKHLIECGDRHANEDNYYAVRDAALVRGPR